MRLVRIIVIAAIAAVLATHPAPLLGARQGATQASPRPRVESRPRLPLVFEENRGQADPAARFVARSTGMLALIRDAGATFVATSASEAAPGQEHAPASRHRDVLHMDVVAAAPSAHARGVGLLPGVSHYLRGPDERRWIRDVPHRRSVISADVVRGVDLIWRDAGDGALAYDLIVAPGIDPTSIRLRMRGHADPHVSEAGALVVPAAGGQWHHLPPFAYQVVDGIRTVVPCEFIVDADGAVRFAVDGHDRACELVIDPTIRFVTFFGGSSGNAPNRERARAVALGPQNSVFLAGAAQSTDFPISSAPVSTFQGGYTDAFVAKLTADGTSLLYSTYLGGSSDDEARGIAVNGSGVAYVCGFTASTDFTLASARDNSFGGGVTDGFIAQLSASGSSLGFSTYHGGNNHDYCYGIALDSNGAVYVTGTTRSFDFPLANAYDGSLSNGSHDAFVSKLNSSGSSLTYSTYLRGSGADLGYAIAVDSSGAAFVVGETVSTDFPTTSSAPQSSHGGGGEDAFVTKFAPNGGSLTFSTYLGGSGSDGALGVAIENGSAYVCGWSGRPTGPLGFPTTSNAYQGTHSSSANDCFVTKFAPTGSSHAYSTLVGGGNTVSNATLTEAASAIAVDSRGIAYVAGWTDSTSFPTVNATKTTFSAGAIYDGCAFALNSAGTGLHFSTYFGGTGSDQLFGVAVAEDGTFFVAGGAGNSSGLTTTGVYQPTHGGSFYDGIVGRFGQVVAPEPATGLLAVARSDTQVDLTWDAPGPIAETFEVERAAGTEEFVALTTVGRAVTSYADADLGGESDLRYRIRTTNDAGQSDWSDPVTAVVPPPPPGSVTTTGHGSRWIGLAWSDDTDEEAGYAIERGEGCPGDGWSVIAVAGADVESYTDFAAQPETTYSYRLRARGVEADSAPSEEACDTTAPHPPSSLVAITQSDVNILLRWSDSSSVETSYEVERQLTQGGAGEVLTLPSNTFEREDVTVAAETEYRFRVRAVGEFGPSDWSVWATARTAPAAPGEPMGRALAPSRLRISWTDKSSVESGYELRRRIHGSDSIFALVDKLPPNTTSFVDRGLLQETSYDYTVNAYDSFGDSNAIAIDDLKTTAVLVIRKVKRKAAKKKKPASLSVQADIDFGGYQPDATDGATLGVNGEEFTVGQLRLKKKGRVLSGDGDGYSFTLSRQSPTASRGSLKITVTGVAAEIADGAELTTSFKTGSFAAAGTVELSAGRFDLNKRVGLRVDPDVVPTKLKLKLGGTENDTLQLGATFQPRAVPAEQPNALITVGEHRLILAGVSTEVKGGRVTYRREGLPDATLTIDYDKGTLKLKAKKHELGDYDKGDVPTLLDVTIGELRWRDVPVLHSTGTTVTF